MPSVEQNEALFWHGKYNRACPRCNCRWTAEGTKVRSMDGQEIEIEECGKCAPRRLKYADRAESRDKQLGKILKRKKEANHG